MTNILNPNQPIDGNDVAHDVAAKGSSVLGVVIDAETESSLTLCRVDERTETTSQRDIEEIRSTGVSLIPEEPKEADHCRQRWWTC